ncbi:chemotaxis protein CheR [Pontivivens ytuae]|uniref:protein-glutamate O-methyltransferase n=2 Tax=Pontivivens ytuae TaxID=2789856 RepID=A0A7S9QD82_9RHOB|nr:chemotaxis protein CheR [Pontivivens ytuae]
MAWVGIGASAGGLEALSVLAKNLPAQANATYIVVQHMAPQHKSLLRDLVSRETHLTVVEISSGVVPKPDHIYITPPNSNLSIANGRLELLPPDQTPSAPKPSIDGFFIDLADEIGPRAIGVILSGTGSDGAFGVRAIRAAGGITIAQDEASAKYDGMPMSAQRTGCIDLVLPPEDIGVKFKEILETSRDAEGLAALMPPVNSLAEINQLLFAQTNVDFRDYKPSTIHRRIERRMAALGLERIADYVERLRADKDEVETLFRDMLISVTSFFRDQQEFKRFDTAIKRIVEEHDDTLPLRVWVPGCATGEEAYSIAMLFAEAMGGPDTIDRNRLQIFASDIDREALKVGRRGLYPASSMTKVSEDLLTRYFTAVGDSFKVVKPLRDVILFAEHNVSQDPPFLNLDLVCCRNLLIYFGQELQYRVMSRMYTALKEDGLVFLGMAESMTGVENLFLRDSTGGKIFRKREAADVDLAPLRPSARAQMRTVQRLEEQAARHENREDGRFAALVSTLGPNAVLVTSDYKLRRVFGEIDDFVSIPSGDVKGASVDYLKGRLANEARVLISLAQRGEMARHSGLLPMPGGTNERALRLSVYPLPSERGGETLYLLVFAETDESAEELALVDENPGDELVVRELRRQLASTRETLQQTIEELETSNEELQSLNEELQSTNEELQSTNEELETANEELQSTNEELITVNEEQQINSMELSLVTKELESILAHLALPVVVLDLRLNVVRASNEARKVLSIPSEAPKVHIAQCELPDGFPRPLSFLPDVVERGETVELEYELNGTPSVVRAVPYRNARNQLAGAVMMVVPAGLKALV